MAATPEFSNIEKRIKELDARIKALGGDGFENLDKALKNMNGDIGQATSLMKLLANEALDLENVFENISTTLKNVVNDLGGGTKAATLMNRSFNKLERIASSIADHKKDENILTIRQLKNLSKQTQIEVENLRNARLKAKEENKVLEKKATSIGLSKSEQDQLERNYSYLAEVNQALNLKNSYLKKIEKYSELEVEREKEIQKTLGLTGQAFKGIASTLEKIGVESEAIEDINLAMRKAAKTGDGLKVILEGIKGSALAAYDTLTTDPTAQLAFLVKTFKTLYDLGANFSKDTANIARELGMSNKEAAVLNKEFYSLQQNSNDAFGNQKNFLQSTLELNEALGTSATFSAEVLATQARISQVTGLTAEESAEIYKFSLLTGETQEEIYDSVGGIRKGNLNNKKVLQEVLKTSGQLAAQYKNNPILLGKAVVQAQKLGLTLEQTKNISKNLLNFEDSISAELEAELLTGQDLNLERARYLSLMGDSAGAAEELMKNLGPNGLAKFQKMNVIQQEAYDRALGMGVDELADSLVKQKQLESLDKGQAKLLKERIQKLKDAGETEKAAELEKQALAGKNVELAEQQLDAQAKIAQATETFKSAIQAVIAGPLGAMADKVASIMEMISKSTFAKEVLGFVGGIGAVAAAATSVFLIGKTLVNSLKNAFLGKPSGRDGDEVNVKIKGGTPGMGGDGGASTGGGGGTFGKGTFGRLGSKGGRDVLRRAGKGSLVKGVGKGIMGAGKGLLKGGGKGLLKGGAKRIPYLGALLGAGMEFADGGFNLESVGRAALSGGGAFLGGLGGSLVAPGLGTFAGGVAGGMAGDYLGDKIFGEREETELATGGIVTKPTKALVGEAGAEAVIPLDKLMTEFKEMRAILTQIANREGTVYLDGTKVGTAMAMSTYKTQ